MSGSQASAIAAATAIGTMASGTANSNGTTPSCVARVQPNGVSKRTSMASTSTSTHTSAGTIAKACGGSSAHRPASAAMKAAPMIVTATRSRLSMRECSRATDSARSSCSSKLGSKDISAEISIRSRSSL